MPRGKGQKTIEDVMSRYRRGTLRAGKDPKGPKKAPKAKSRKQAIAIALSEAGMSKPEKRAKGGAIKKFSPISKPQRFRGVK